MVVAPGRLLIPGLLLRRHEPVLDILDQYVPDVAKFTLAYHVTRLAYSRIAGIVVSQCIDKVTALDDLRQLLGFIQAEGHRLIRSHADALFQEGFSGRKVHVVGPRDHDKIDPILSPRFSLRHCLEVVVRTIQVPGFGGSSGPLGISGHRASYDLCLAVQLNGYVMHGSDKRALASSDDTGA